jgi:copper chaperone CopZ
MRIFSISMMLGLALVAVSCRTKDVRTVLVYAPGMKNAACSEIVVRAVSKCVGVDASKTRVDLMNHTVTVTYDSLITALKNIEFAIAEAGFQANEVPPECRVMEKY